MWTVEVYYTRSLHLYTSRKFAEEKVSQVSKYIDLVPKGYVWVLYKEGEALDYGLGTS